MWARRALRKLTSSAGKEFGGMAAQVSGDAGMRNSQNVFYSGCVSCENGRVLPLKALLPQRDTAKGCNSGTATTV
jgi:hypothetical protein